MINLGTLRGVIIVLTFITAGVHLVLGGTGLDGLFVLNGLGSFTLLAALLLDQPLLNRHRALIHYIFMGYMVVTIAAYFIVNGGDSFSNPLGLFDKAVEVGLIAALGLHLRQTRRAA